MATAPLPTRPRIPSGTHAATPPSHAKPAPHRRPGFRREQLSGWGMIAPAAVLLLAFIFIPAILGLRSLAHNEEIRPPVEWALTTTWSWPSRSVTRWKAASISGKCWCRSVTKFGVW